MKKLNKGSINHILSYVGLGIIFVGIIGACKTSLPSVPPPVEPVIMTIGGEKIKTADFFQSFTKNQFSDDTTKQTDIKGYLELYTNHKVKLMAAQQKGLDKTTTFREELESFRKVLAQPYLTDKVLTDNLVAEAYERLKEEIRVSHILFPVARDASPADTLSAYRAALAIRGQIVQNDISFEEAAQRYSKDINSAGKGGDLGYITAFQLIYPIENLAYHQPVGKVSDLVRSSAGYHLIKVTDKRPSRGRVQVAHILVRMSNAATEEGKAAAKAKIEQAHALLQQESWDNVCSQFSDDETTKNAGGILREFGTGEWMPAFEQKAFSLHKVGDISEPFLTNYGWHIIKLIHKKGILSFDELAPNLRAKIKTDTRGAVLNQALIKKLRNTYKIEEIGNLKELAFSQVDSTLLSGRWKYKEPLINTLDKKTIFHIDNLAFTANQFYDYINKIQEPVSAGSTLPVLLQRYYTQFQNKALIEAEEQNLENKNTEFQAAYRDVYEGMLISQMKESNVLEKSLTDSLTQKQIWQETKEKYRYPERAFTTIISTDNDSLLAQVQRVLALPPPYPLRRRGQDLLFTSNNIALTPNHQEAIFDVIATLLANESYQVEVSAYQEATEKDSVAAARLQKVIAMLNANGVNSTRIIEKNYDKFRPVANAVRNRRISFQFLSNSKKDVINALNTLKIGKVSIEEGVYAKGTNAYVDAVPWQVGNNTTTVGGKKAWIYIQKVEPARIKTFAEARGAVINEYQRRLEKSWLDQLKQQFPVQVNEEELKKLTK